MSRLLCGGRWAFVLAMATMLVMDVGAQPLPSGDEEPSSVLRRRRPGAAPAPVARNEAAAVEGIRRALGQEPPHPGLDLALQLQPPIGGLPAELAPVREVMEDAPPALAVAAAVAQPPIAQAGQAAQAAQAVVPVAQAAQPPQVFAQHFPAVAQFFDPPPPPAGGGFVSPLNPRSPLFTVLVALGLRRPPAGGGGSR